MVMPNPSGLIRKQTEAVGAQFDNKKAEIMGSIAKKVEEQIREIHGNEKAQLAGVDSKITELEAVLSSMDPNDPRRKDLARNIGLLKEQKKQIKAQVKLAIATVKANAAREKENIRTRLEREKGRAIRSAVEAALAQFNMLMQRRAQQQGAVQDELKSGNRG